MPSGDLIPKMVKDHNPSLPVYTYCRVPGNRNWQIETADWIWPNHHRKAVSLPKKKGIFFSMIFLDFYHFSMIFSGFFYHFPMISS